MAWRYPIDHLEASRAVSVQDSGDFLSRPASYPRIERTGDPREQPVGLKTYRGYLDPFLRCPHRLAHTRCCRTSRKSENKATKHKKQSF